MKHGHERELERVSREVRGELEARFNRILADLQASADPAKRVAAALIPPREVTCPKCGKQHQGRAKKGYCLWCLNQMAWKKGGGEAFRARNAGVKSVGYGPGEGEPAIQPIPEPGRCLEDPYALDTDRDGARAADPGRWECGVPELLGDG